MFQLFLIITLATFIFSIPPSLTTMDTLRECILAERSARFNSSFRLHENLKSISMAILKDVADILNVPFSYCKVIHPSNDTHDKKEPPCITIPLECLKSLDNLWLQESNHQRLTTEEQSILQKIQMSGEHVYVHDLTQFLKILIRKSTIPGRGTDKTERVLKNRQLPILLAVDGFSGYLINDFKRYISHLNLSENLHVKAVRKMYEHFDSREALAGLTGTDSVCIVFLVLLKTFLQQMKQGQIDDSVRIVVSQFYGSTEQFLQRNAHYYRDIREILSGENSKWLDELKQVYLEHFNNHQEELNKFALEKMNHLYQLGKKRIVCNDPLVKKKQNKPKRLKKRLHE